MQTIQDGYKSFGLLLSINWDRLMYVFVIVASLFLGAFLGTYLLEVMSNPIGY